MDTLKAKYETDKIVWDECAETYERQIVGGHPDITAFENFEEDLLDKLLRHVAENQSKPIKLMDIGCGSGRLHLRYGAKTKNTKAIKNNEQLKFYIQQHPHLNYEPSLALNLKEVWGIDFSHKMLNIAKDKLKSAGLFNSSKPKLTFEQGSAFELKPESENLFPISVCLVNSIGVMQGKAGAEQLFISMKKAVEKAKGLAIISNYQKEYIESYALGQYESTLDVSGQPIWLSPDTFSSEEYQLIPQNYKLAHSKDQRLKVSVYDKDGKYVTQELVLKRDKAKVEEMKKTGEIKTYTDYESNWYGFDIMNEWIKKHWGDKTYHIKTKEIDSLRAEPAQLSIYDPSGILKNFFERLGVA